jgi:hypothetical protein
MKEFLFLVAHHGYLIIFLIVIAGGLAAWRKAGLPLEPVPHTGLVHLPIFSR